MAQAHKVVHEHIKIRNGGMWGNLKARVNGWRNGKGGKSQRLGKVRLRVLRGNRSSEGVETMGT